jgi:hypothetical protein
MLLDGQPDAVADMCARPYMASSTCTLPAALVQPFLAQCERLLRVGDGILKSVLWALHCTATDASAAA